jgi:hypothetical protein
MLALSLSARILNENANQAIFSLVMVTQFNLYITVNVSSLFVKNWFIIV